MKMEDGRWKKGRDIQPGCPGGRLDEPSLPLLSRFEEKFVEY
jgi:hypothetical protein